MNFQNRTQAGEKLAQQIAALHPADPIVLAIPREGVAVARPVADALACPLDVIPLMKLPIPWSAEASYGVVAMDGTMVWNRSLMNRLDLSERELEMAASAFTEEAKRRERVYRKDEPFPDLERKTVVLIDDGLGSGYSMLAAVHFTRKRNPGSMIIAAPVISDIAYRLLAAEAGVDRILALVRDVEQYFSLKTYFSDYSFLTDDDVIRTLG
ncbi:MAG TPA: phosphoribosyltransferase family protein [Nitrospirota bacterium]|nr:phosphoribosyltransferase family protein [Nitrospirota bacterium]